MIVILFGLAGSGKNYVGELLSQETSFHFWDADNILTDEMLQCIQTKMPFTQAMRDRYFLNVMHHLNELNKQYENIIVSQAFYKDKNRIEYLKHFPQLIFIQVTASMDVLSQRLAQRNTIDRHYLEQISQQFEQPTHDYFLLENDTTLNPMSLVEQFMKILLLQSQQEQNQTAQGCFAIGTFFRQKLNCNDSLPLSCSSFNGYCI